MDNIDARFGPILEAIDDAVEPFDLKAGESIYMLTVLLLGCIQDAPADIRELFRGAAVQALLRQRDSGRVLKELCFLGEVA